jgi:hypothetical protein
MMLTVKGIYKEGRIELCESLGDIKVADLFIVVMPREGAEERTGPVRKVFKDMVMEPEAEFKQMGLVNFFDTQDDKDVDWEEAFGLKDR